MRSFWLARALLVGLWLSFGVHLPAWSRDAKPGNFYSLLPIWIPGGNRGTPDWRSVVQRWNPGNPFCVVRIVCFPVQVKYVIPPGGKLFAPRPGRFHAGEDYAVPYGSAVYSAFNGVETNSGTWDGCKNSFGVIGGNPFNSLFPLFKANTPLPKTNT